MNEQEVINLFNNIKSANPQTKWTLDKLKEKLKTKETRKEFYENESYKTYLTSLGISLGTLEEFENKYGTSKPAPKKTKTPTKTFSPVDISRDEMCNGTKEVSEGMKGDIVGYIQAALNANLNINLNEDDEFGEETRKAVAKFQYENKKEYNLTINGKVDKATYSALMEGSPSFGCKTDVKKTTDVIKSTDVKPNEVKPKVDEPNKMKKIPIPTGVTYREKYTGKIKEQVIPPVPTQTADNQQKVVSPQTILKRVIRTGCIDSLKKEIGFELIGGPESQPAKFGEKFAIIGFNQNDFEYIYLFSDGTGQKQKVDKNYKSLPNQPVEEFDWECPQLKQTTSLTADETQMSEDQQKFVRDIVAAGNGYYKTEMPSGYDEGQGAWKRTDLSKVEGGEGLFKPNTFFVWANTGVVGKRQNYVQKVTKFIEGTGYSFDEPDVTSAAFETGVLLGDKFPKYRDYFKPDQKIWYVGKTYSGKEQGQVGSVVEKIKVDAGTELKKEFCKGGVDVLYDAAYNPTKIYFENDADLQMVKDYVKRCVRELKPNAMSNLLGGSRKKFEFLRTQRAGTQGSLRFMLGEQKNTLNSLIKKKLFEAKEKKEDNTIGKQLIENRLKMIVESIKKQGNIIEKKNFEKISLEFINELKELNNQGLINENLGDSLKNIFGTGLETMPQKFFEVIFDRILTKLGLNDVALKNALVDSAKNNPSEIVNSFKDCELMTELIAKTITEILYMNLQSEKNLKGQGWNLIRNILGQEIKKEEFLKNIKTNLNSVVCQEFSNLTSNSQNLLSKIKGATI